MCSLLASCDAWTLLSTGLSLCNVINFVSIANQITLIAGKKGISPFAETLSQIKRDFPTTRARWQFFPSVFWLTGSSDAALLLVPLVGAATALASAAACLIGVAGVLPCARVACWVILRSLDLPVGLLYPWDALLLEAAAFHTLLPSTPGVPPHPWVAASFRWLLARVMLGFGKKKFLGTDASHSCYIKNFLIAQPLPSPLGWLACRLPLGLFQAALAVMFLVECVAPVILLCAGGAARAGAALSIAALMVGIQVGGNFGYFNVLTAVLCLSGLDTSASALDPLPPLSVSEGLLRALLGAHFALSCLFLLFDSWCSTAWPYWPQLALARKPWVQALVTSCRLVADQRLLHAYGVFPPNSNPPVRMAAVFEGRAAGESAWRRYEWRYLPSSPRSAPRFVAPHHPRLDHSIFYVSLGVGPDNYLASINSPRPYSFAKDSLVHRIAHLLLDGNTPAARRIFRNEPFPSSAAPPDQVRVLLLALEPTSVREARSSGVYWTESVLGEHLPPIRRDGPTRAPPHRERVGRRHPLLFHPDLLPVWRSRVPELSRLLAAPLPHKERPGAATANGVPTATRRASRSPLRARLTPSGSGDNGGRNGGASGGGGGMSAQDAAGHLAELSLEGHAHAASLSRLFWEDFVPSVGRAGATASWAAGEGLVARAEALRARLDEAVARATPRQPASTHELELILGGVVLRLLPRLEERHMRRTLPRLGGAAPSYLHLVLVAHCLVLRGRLATSRFLLGDDSALEEVTVDEVLERGLSFFSVLWTEKLLFHATKYFVAEEIQRKYSTPMQFGHPSLLPGALVLLPHLAAALRPLVWSEDAAAAFPQWHPPRAWADWTRLEEVGG